MHDSTIVSRDISGTISGGLLQEHFEEPPLRQIVESALGLVRRQYLIILIAAAVGLAGSAIYLQVTPPTFKATAKVLLENPKIQFLQQQSLMAPTQVDRTQLENQLEILKSKPIAISVINKLNLANDPDLTGANQPMRPINAMWRWVYRLFTTPTPKAQPRPLQSKQEPSDDIIAAFEDRLVGTHIGQSNVIEINFNSSDPDRAAQIANAVADAYLGEQMNAKFEASRNGTTWLQKRLEELGQQTLAAERAVNEFRLKNKLVEIGGNSMDDQQVTELNSRLVTAREQAAEALARMNRYEAVLRASSAAAGSASADLDAPLSATLNNPIINNLRQQYLEYARRESEWAGRLGPSHSAVVSLRAKMLELRNSIAAEVRRLAETSRNDLEIAKQRESAVMKQLADAVSQSQASKSAELTMRELEMNAKSYRNLYDSFLQQYMRSIQQQSLPVADARVISPASPPQGKSKPKSGLIIALGLFLGAAMGAGLGLLRDVMDRAFRTTAQVKSALHTTCLALVPLVDNRMSRQLARRHRPAKDLAPQRTIVRNSGTLWTASGMPLSHFAESIRFIKLAINLSSGSTPNRIIGITSALAHEGKSTIAAAVGEYITQSGGRVIIVDCDLRNPSLSNLLAPSADAGIIEVLSGKQSLEETVWTDAKTGLEFLPAASKSTPIHTSEILSAEATRRLFKRLRGTYDYVIVDLPPLTPIVDVRATTPWIDGYILTIEWGRTNIDVVQHALRTAPDVRDALIGAVLNKVDMNSIGRYDSREARYYRYKDYTRSAA